MANPVLLQFFHWYTPADGQHWRRLTDSAKQLKSAGIDAVWIPPPYKAMGGGMSVGYDTYDLFDLGEFDQKGSVRTKYGTKNELETAIKTAHRHKISVLADVVLNHKAGADEREKFWVRKVNPHNRNEYLSNSLEIEGWTKFIFPGRQGKYSTFTWHWWCFNGVDYAHDHPDQGLFAIQENYGSEWAELVDNEKGNYDYLMFADLEMRNPDVRGELRYWGGWFLKTTNVDGFRLDAIKHIPPAFFVEWLDHVRSTTKKYLFAVGEYWNSNLDVLLRYLKATGNRMSLFDVPLHYQLHSASINGNRFDLRSLFEHTLVQAAPMNAVTFVDNHDSQPLQALESSIQEWFKPHAYTLILLRKDGLPCVFLPDLEGAEYTDKSHDIHLKPVKALPDLLKLRKKHAFGEQIDHFDHPNTIGWVRTGNYWYPGVGCAVVLANGDAGHKTMSLGTRFAYNTFIDALGNHPAEIKLDHHGSANFLVSPGSVSVWVKKTSSTPLVSRDWWQSMSRVFGG
jgi:alpha-amylase